MGWIVSRKPNETKHPIPVRDQTTGRVLGVLLDREGRPMMLSEADIFGDADTPKAKQGPDEFGDDEMPF